MSLSTITIYRDYAIIDGFVQVPPNKETDKSRVTVAEALAAIDGSAQVHLTGASGANRGGRAGAQSLLRLPGLIPGAAHATDPVDTLAAS